MQPTGLGTDPALDALAQACFDGDLAACDELWRQTTPTSPYRVFADTCAGRQPSGTGVFCVDAFTPPTTDSGAPTTTVVVPAGTPPSNLGTDATLDALAQSCYGGDMLSCDALFDLAPVGSPYQQYGDTCGGRQAPETYKYCRVAYPDPPATGYRELAVRTA